MATQEERQAVWREICRRMPRYAEIIGELPEWAQQVVLDTICEETWRRLENAIVWHAREREEQRMRNGKNMAAQIFVNALDRMSDVDLLAFVAANMLEADDPVTKYAGARLSSLAVQLEAGSIVLDRANETREQGGDAS